MTDAQSFYLLLAAFYLYECLSFAPNGARAFVGPGQGRWHWRRPAFYLSGAHKEVFCAPIVPWPGMLLVFPSGSPKSPPSSQALRHLMKRTVMLEKMTRPLRLQSLAVFLHYFAILPYLYYFYLGSLWVIAAIVAGELLAVATAIRFYFLHRRLFPKDKGERRLETFFNAFFPWHAMRANDLILKRITASWDPLVCLASAPGSQANLKELARAWRTASYRGETSNLETVIAQTDLDPSTWTEPPDLEKEQQFCPVCHTIYEEGPTDCADCPSVVLQSETSLPEGTQKIP